MIYKSTTLAGILSEIYSYMIYKSTLAGILNEIYSYMIYKSAGKCTAGSQSPNVVRS
jgi:hypothetical protein